MTLPEILTERCALLGITQAELARRLEGREANRQRVNNWFKGVSRPAADDLPALCDALGLDVDGARVLYEACGIPLAPVLRDGRDEAVA